MAFNIDLVWLSSRVQVKRYRELERTESRSELAKFIFERFIERYIEPIQHVQKGYENGFLTMAACCLLIESLVAFREGWPSTKGKSEAAFKKFFQREDRFKAFRGCETSFWKGIRCGILHQGETALGWRLNFSRPGEPLFVSEENMVNCAAFLRLLVESLNDYRTDLENAHWQDLLWDNFKTKMAATIKDCQP